jgi:ABC-2 type transport system ATP-binding protein
MRHKHFAAFQANKRLAAHLRLPLVVIPLLAIGYCCISLVWLVPNFQFSATWKPDGVMRVTRPYPDTVVAKILQTDDIIVAIDGKAVRRSTSTWLFQPGREEYHYTILRNSEALEVEAPVGSMTWYVLRIRLPSTILAVFVWLVGAIIVMFAPPSNREAWLVGAVVLGLATIVATSEASLYGIPYTWLASAPLLPAISVAYVYLAMLPSWAQGRIIFRWLFGFAFIFALLLGAVCIYEIFWLDPRGLSTEILTGVSLDDILLLVFAIGLVLNPAILFVRYVAEPVTYIRHQMALLLVATAVSVAPLVLLTILPLTLVGQAFAPWDGTFLFLFLVPAAYGFVILRRNYLELDIYATRTIFSLTFVLILYGVYAVGVIAMERWDQMQATQPVIGLAAFVPAAIISVALSRFLYRTTVSVIYGRKEDYEQVIGQITADVSSNPDMETLRQAFRTFLRGLDVRQGVLLLKQSGEYLEPLETVLREGYAFSWSSNGQMNQLPQSLAIRATEGGTASSSPRFFDEYPWIEAIVPLRSRGQPIGTILLAAPTPGGAFNAQDVRFIRQIADALSIALSASMLFEASLSMARRLLQIRDMERTILAAEIHNEPLQWVSVIAGELDSQVHQMAQLDPSKATDLARIRDRLLLTTDHLRTISIGLRPPVLSQGVQWAIREAVEQNRQEAGYLISLSIDIPPDLVLHDDVTKAIYHVVVEALTNVRKHAQATNVWVNLVLENGGRVHLLVKDDGIGMTSTGLTLSEDVFSRHFGIVGMKQWASIAGGVLNITSEYAKGTQIDAYFPFDPASPIRSLKMNIPRQLVTVEKIGKLYPTTQESAVSDISFRMAAGSILTLLGPNGAGKTTTVKMICGLVRPTTGSVQIMDHDVTTSRSKAVRHIGAVLEGARNVYWRLSARDNLYYFGSLRAVPHAELLIRIPRLLDMMDLTQDQDKEVRFFSRGMQQKLAIAAALIHDPAILLLDEPTLGLDVHSARRVEDVLLQLARQEGKAILLTTHTMPLAEKIADEIFVIHEGRRVAYDTTANLLNQYDADKETVEIAVEGDMPSQMLGEISELIPSVRLSKSGSLTLLQWSLSNQSQILYVLELLNQHELTITNVSRRRPSLEEVFLALVEGAGA